MCTWRPSWTAARRKRSGTRLGRPHAAPVLVCEAIDMAARKCPYTTGETILLPRAVAPRYTSAQFAYHPEGHGTLPPVGRTGMRWAGARAEAGRRHPQGTRGSIRWSTTARSETVRDIASQVEPDTQVRHSPTPPRCTGHRTRMTRSTEQQDKQPETHPTAQALLATLPTPCRAQRRLSQ